VTHRPHRRTFLSAGTLGLLGLPDYLRRAAAAGRAADRSAIFVFLHGGPSHIDTFDPKPDAPAEVRGEFKPIKTAVPGVEVCELLPKLAKRADTFALLRSVAHAQAEHTMGQKFLTTGNPPTPAVQYPTYGAVVGKEFPAPAAVPPFVSIRHELLDTNDTGVTDTSGYLGAASGPFQVKGDPSSRDFGVRAMKLPEGLGRGRIDARHALLDDLDTGLRDAGVKSQDLAGMDKFYRQAQEMLSSPKAREAFDLSREPAGVRDGYGRTYFGQSCLLARRLIEAGVRFVSINFSSWDAHGNIFPAMKRKLPELDAGVAGLLADLADRRMLDATTVLVTGEFGRTPKVNGIAGRDHWSRAMSVLMAGGGVKGGQVIGRTNDRGEEPTDAPLKPEDVAVSLYRALGIDPAKEYHTATGRPIPVVRGGTVIKGLFA
jgi:uncharacterized protein (DUF1501 family)